MHQGCEVPVHLLFFFKRKHVCNEIYDLDLFIISALYQQSTASKRDENADEEKAKNPRSKLPHSTLVLKSQERAPIHNFWPVRATSLAMPQSLHYPFGSHRQRVIFHPPISRREQDDHLIPGAGSHPQWRDGLHGTLGDAAHAVAKGLVVALDLEVLEPDLGAHLVNLDSDAGHGYAEAV